VTKLDKLVALALLAFMLAYGWSALDYQLLPFEQYQAFKPNTMPIGLASIGIVLALAVLFMPRPKGASVVDESTVDHAETEAERLKNYDKIRPAMLILFMVVYALSLRPVGFVVATAGFLLLSAATLGERKFHILIPVALGGALLIWYVVHELLGIYMNPWPVGTLALPGE